MTRSYIAREELAEMIFEHLSNSDSTSEEARLAIGITRKQWINGLKYLKDQLADYHSTPIVYDPVTYRYSLALSEDEVTRYETFRLKSLHRQLQRLYTGTAKPAMSSFPDSVTARRFLLHLRNAVEEAELLVDEVQGVPAHA